VSDKSICKILKHIHVYILSAVIAGLDERLPAFPFINDHRHTLSE